MSPESIITILLGSGFGVALLTAFIERRMRASNADNLDRQSITTAEGALRMANAMLAAAQADAHACRDRVLKLEAFITAKGLTVPA